MIDAKGPPLPFPFRTRTEGESTPSKDEVLLARLAAFERAERLADIGSFQVEVATLTIRWSPHMFRLFGLPPEARQPTSDEFLGMIHPEDVDMVTMAASELLRRGHVEPFTYRVNARDGVQRTLLARMELVYDETGTTPLLICGTASDETARLRAERLTSRGERLIDVGRVVGSVAHDWNNLLSVIVASATLALRGTTEAPVKAELTRLLSACESSATLLRQMLAFSRRQELARRLIGLDEVLAPIEWMVKRLLGPRVEVSIEITRDPWRIIGDPGGIERALVNLALNAREAMPNGGNVKITVENREASERAGAGAAEPKAYTVLSMTDDGAGMSKETRERAFEPFFSTKGESGTGLGLSTVQAIVKDHGGLVELESEEGKGTTVRLLFPRAAS